jgi:hypothetical protein
MYGMSPQPSYGSYNSYGAQGYATDYGTTFRSEQQPTQASLQQDRTRDNQVSQLPGNRERLTARSRQITNDNRPGPDQARSSNQGSLVLASQKPKPQEPGLGKLLGVRIESKKTLTQTPIRLFGTSLW